MRKVNTAKAKAYAKSRGIKKFLIAGDSIKTKRVKSGSQNYSAAGYGLSSISGNPRKQVAKTKRIKAKQKKVGGVSPRRGVK